MPRPWIDIADVVLSLALLVAAGSALAQDRPVDGVAAVVLALVWGVVATRRIRRRRRGHLTTTSVPPTGAPGTSHPATR